METTKEKKISKIGMWMRSKHEPVVDFSIMSEKQIKSMYRAILK